MEREDNMLIETCRSKDRQFAAIRLGHALGYGFVLDISGEKFRPRIIQSMPEDILAEFASPISSNEDLYKIAAIPLCVFQEKSEELLQKRYQKTRFIIDASTRVGLSVTQMLKKNGWEEGKDYYRVDGCDVAAVADGKAWATEHQSTEKQQLKVIAPVYTALNLNTKGAWKCEDGSVAYGTYEEYLDSRPDLQPAEGDMRFRANERMATVEREYTPSIYTVGVEIPDIESVRHYCWSNRRDVHSPIEAVASVAGFKMDTEDLVAHYYSLGGAQYVRNYANAININYAELMSCITGGERTDDGKEPETDEKDEKDGNSGDSGR